jgi:thioesterase domain-containing protein
MTGPTIRATPMQEALWWVHQRARNKSVYNITWRMSCSRAPDLAALEIAWQAVVDRHDSLRTSLVLNEDVLELVALPELLVGVHRIEVDSEPSAELFELIAEEVHDQPMRLDQAPLARLAAVRIGDQHELLLIVHHVVSDGWGNQLMVSDLSEAYVAACQGRKPCFAEEAPSFLEYAASSPDRGKSLEYWTKTLDGGVATTVAADRHATGNAGSTVRYALSDDAMAGVAELTRTAMATPFVVALAALQIVLARGGAGPEVGVGVIAANRLSRRDLSLVGYTANLCMTTTTVTQQDTLLEVVTRARDAMWDMFVHQTVPYSVVYGALPEAAQRTLGETPPLLLDYLGQIGTGLFLGDIELTLQRSPNRTARTDLVVVMWDAGNGLMTELEYNTGRYDRSTVLGLMEDIDAVLSADVKTPLAGLNLLTRSIAGYVDHRADPVPAGRLPDTPITDQVSGVWQRVLGQPPVGPEEDFFAQGGRSLKVLQLASAIRAETGVDLDLSRWLNEPTPARLIEQIATTVPGGSSTLVVLRDGDGPHLHLLPGAGGGPHNYRALLDALPAHWRVTASQERGQYMSIAEMAEAYHADLDGLPDILGGWSMGGLIAFEIARVAPAPLVLLDPAPPIGYDNEYSWFDSFVAMTSAGLGVQVDVPRAGELNIAVLAAYLKLAGQDVPAALLAERWGIFQRHAKAVAGYLPESGVSAPALLVVAELLDSQVDQWRKLLGPTESMRLDTDHFGVLSAESVRTIATKLCAIPQHEGSAGGVS